MFEKVKCIFNIWKPNFKMLFMHLFFICKKKNVLFNLFLFIKKIIEINKFFKNEYIKKHNLTQLQTILQKVTLLSL